MIKDLRILTLFYFVSLLLSVSSPVTVYGQANKPKPITVHIEQSTDNFTSSEVHDLQPLHLVLVWGDCMGGGTKNTEVWLGGSVRPGWRAKLFSSQTIRAPKVCRQLEYISAEWLKSLYDINTPEKKIDYRADNPLFTHHAQNIFNVPDDVKSNREIKVVVELKSRNVIGMSFNGKKIDNRSTVPNSVIF